MTSIEWEGDGESQRDRQAPQRKPKKLLSESGGNFHKRLTYIKVCIKLMMKMLGKQDTGGTARTITSQSSCSIQLDEEKFD